MQSNFLFILSDDQGYWSLGSYGNPEIHTPVLDKLAGEGTLFKNFYCTSPVCSPARASILTGLMPSSHGVLDWIGGGAVPKSSYARIKLPRQMILDQLAPDVSDEEISESDESLPYTLTRNYRRFMRYENEPIRYLDQPILPELLSRHGYRCGISGKWHLGAAEKPHPGFDFWSVVPKGGTPYKMPDWISDGQLHIGTQYVTDLITDEALRFLEGQNPDQPFYLSVHFTAPHDPWRASDHPEDILDLYRDCPFDSLPREPLHPHQVLKRPHPESDEEWRDMATAYYASITAMDRSIGRLIDRLKEQNLLENTVLIFCSDNGLNFGHHGIWGKGNGTYPMNLYETSVKVPCLIWNVPGQKANPVETPASQYDFFPTILDLARVDLPDDGLARPGRSLLPLLRGEAITEAGPVVVCDEYGPVRMIRKGRWKLIQSYINGQSTLYDLEADPHETRNLAGEEDLQERIESLRDDLESWFDLYALADRDGRQYPVNGEGQMGLATDWYQGKTIFVEQDGQAILHESKKES